MRRLNFRRACRVLGLLAGLVLAVAVLSLMFGETAAGLRGMLSGRSFDRAVVLDMRLPRTLLGAIVGGGLAVVGAAFQGLLRNPLAEPYVLGASGGAAVGGSVALVMGLGRWGGLPVISVAAFGGSLLSIVVVFRLASSRGHLRLTDMLLVGVIVNLFASAIVTLLKVGASAQKAQELLFWLMGSLSTESMLMTMGEFLLVALLVAGGAVALCLSAPALNALSLGEETALTLGFDTDRVKHVVFVASSVVTGAVVSVAGLVGFVGLVAPHALRRIIGPDNRLLLPASALAGAAFLIAADTLARVCFHIVQRELPVGVITALVGGPLFVAILCRRPVYIVG